MVSTNSGVFLEVPKRELGVGVIVFHLQFENIDVFQGIVKLL